MCVSVVVVKKTQNSFTTLFFLLYIYVYIYKVMAEEVEGGSWNTIPSVHGFFWRERNACCFDRQDLSVAKLKIFIVKVLK